MIRTALFAALALCFLLPSGAAFAQPEIVKDSVYFTLDDGIMTKEEMEEEAQYVYDICNRNPFQNQYFDCGCIAGDFLIQREKLGPMVMQDDIFTAVTSGPNARCANAPMIANLAYNNCLDFVKIANITREETPEFCTCAANKAALDFAKTPKLDTTFSTSVASNALIYCNDPQKRSRFMNRKSAAGLN